MCTIIAYAGTTLSFDQFRQALSRTASRGPDMELEARAGSGWLGFNRLAIMGTTIDGMQPFNLDDDLCVCNGEIYGFKALRSQLVGHGYTFKSGSDCEVLLPMYRQYGLDMFSRLDAEFALIIYDHVKDQLIAARDPLGIRPLFYGHDAGGGLLLASEARNLAGLCADITPFPPGYYYADGRFTRYCDLTAAGPVRRDSMAEIQFNIRKLLTQAVAKRLDSDAPLGFLLSGGLDSSLVCALAARQLHRPLRTFAIGMDTDAIDLKYARQVADFIRADHHEVIITRDDVIKALPAVIHALASYDITTVRASMGMYLVCKHIHEHTDIRVLLTGEVSDELFGYKYTDYAPNAAAFQAEEEKRVRELYLYDVLRADRCLAVNSLEARVPFGDPQLVRYVMSLDPAVKMNTYGQGKYLLRKAFEGDYLPPAILWREKAAFSDAVGHSLVDDLKAYAESCYTDEQLAAGCKHYDWVRPFTKESLLYRDIFERFYPGQGRMIPAYWMPNRDWPGCDVTDPSARVLANYGASGK